MGVAECRKLSFCRKLSLCRLPDLAFLIQPERGAGAAPHGRGRAHLESDPLARGLHDGGVSGAWRRHPSRMAAHCATCSSHVSSSMGSGGEGPASGAAVG